MTEISVQTRDSRLHVTSPYHPAFPAAARRLGGRFDGATKAWTFDPRDEDRVRELLTDTYGTDGTAQGETVTVRADLGQRYGRYREATYYLGGRQIAHRPGRDERVRLGDGVVVVTGGFPSSGGSRAHPDLNPQEGTVLEVRDLPKAAADDELERDGVTLVEVRVDREALEAERERLRARLAEIDQLLG